MRKAKWTLLLCGVNTLLLLHKSAAADNSLVMQRADGCVVMEAGNAHVNALTGRSD